jgi:hypothetical protein
MEDVTDYIACEIKAVGDHDDHSLLVVRDCVLGNRTSCANSVHAIRLCNRFPVCMLSRLPSGQADVCDVQRETSSIIIVRFCRYLHML